MRSNIFIPETIRVGYQKRNDTYTGKLAYVIYLDEKGKVRKEASWNSWRSNDIEPNDFANVPTSGFVLNKKAGGYSTGWNHRQTYTRIYDPRGHEFEIDITNLLYILENTNSIKGKGLEGEFVYGWSGKDLILIPTSSPDYEDIAKFNEARHKKEHIKSKDLKIGATYRTKTNEEWVYMGRFDKWDTEWRTNKDVNKGKHYYFGRKRYDTYYNKDYLSTLELKSLGDKIIEAIDEECTENYAELFDLLERHTSYSPYDKTKDEEVCFTVDELIEYMETRYLSRGQYNYIHLNTSLKDDTRLIYKPEEESYYLQGDWNMSGYNYTLIGSEKDIVDKYQPTYKNMYLVNNKLYRRSY